MSISLTEEEKREICLKCEHGKIWEFGEGICESCVLEGQSYEFPLECPEDKFNTRGRK